MSSWRSFHLFYAQPEHADQLALAAARTLRELTAHHDDWFFIRYAEAGAHLRVRIGAQALTVCDAFHALMAGECAGLAAGVAVSDWVRAISTPDREGKVFAPGTLVEIAYVPETRRYGGPAALLENESLFRVSTGIALRAIELTRSDHARRARLAIDLMLMTAAAADSCGWPPEVFFSTYGTGWKLGLPGLPAAPGSAVLTGAGLPARYAAHRTFVESGRTPDSLVTHWGAAVAQACAAFRRMAGEGLLVSPIHLRVPADATELSRAIAGMIYSQIHMMNNRLGFAPQAEILWSESIAGHFGRAAQPPGLPLDEFRRSLGMPAARTGPALP